MSACADDANFGGDGAAEDAAFDGASSELDASRAGDGDAAMDATASNARADASHDGGSDPDGASMDAELPHPDTSADAATDSAGPEPVDPHALAVDIDYQVRCLDCEPIAADSPARRIHTGVSGPDVTLECEVSLHGTGRLASFSISHTRPADVEGRFSLEIRHARLDGAGDLGPQCEVRVREGTHEYRGGCAGVGSTSSHPCQLQLSMDEADLTGSLRCEKIQHVLSASLFRYVVASGTADEPATFVLHNCDVPDASVGDVDGGT